MRNQYFDNEVKVSDTPDWYTENFVSNSIIKYLLDNGYKIHKEDLSKRFERGEKVIITSKFFTKEIIEVKGLIAQSNRSKLLNEAANNINPSRSSNNSFADLLFSYLVNFGRYYSNENAEAAMGLPNVERYAAIIEKVQDYFITNGLSLKLYLVNQDGSVKVSNLNESL
ncbi:hypothetical protein [Segetibacter koreensis]|uniref:hypothetical protein n=1 Tax=Segetibacter koreensis TaxID=398037 RepID=UPI0003822979|nr:hypothetical protein [Segetibacter koreensis]